MFIIFNNTPYYEMHELFQSCIFSYVKQKNILLLSETEDTRYISFQCTVPQ